MVKKFQELIASNELYEVYMMEKVFEGYTLKKFLKGDFVDVIDKLDINKKISEGEVLKLAEGMLSY